MRSRLTLIGPAREAELGSVLLFRSRFLAPANQSLPFLPRVLPAVPASVHVEKERRRWLVAYKGVEFYVHLDQLTQPALPGYFLEIKSRTWSRRDADGQGRGHHRVDAEARRDAGRRRSVTPTSTSARHKTRSAGSHPASPGFPRSRYGLPRLDKIAAVRYSLAIACRGAAFHARSALPKSRRQTCTAQSRRSEIVIRLIKRYGSRKLYDTEESRYVSLEEIGDWVRQGQQVQIVDNQNGDDVTAQTLTQVILEEGKRGMSPVSSDFLHALIRRGEQMVNTGVESLSQGVDRLLQASVERVGPLRELRDEVKQMRAKIDVLESAISEIEESGTSTNGDLLRRVPVRPQVARRKGA